MTCVTHHHACDCREAVFEASIEKLHQELLRYDEVAELIFNQDNLKGYPTGPEWFELVKKIKTILGKSS